MTEMGWPRTMLTVVVMLAAASAAIVNLWLVRHRPDGIPSLRLYRAGICAAYVATYVGTLADPGAAWPTTIRRTITAVAFITVYILPALLPRPVTAACPDCPIARGGPDAYQRHKPQGSTSDCS